MGHITLLLSSVGTGFHKTWLIIHVQYFLSSFRVSYYPVVLLRLWLHPAAKETFIYWAIAFNWRHPCLSAGDSLNVQRAFWAAVAVWKYHQKQKWWILFWKLYSCLEANGAHSQQPFWLVKEKYSIVSTAYWETSWNWVMNVFSSICAFQDIWCQKGPEVRIFKAPPS